MANLKRQFNEARQLHQQGRLAEAERLYRKIHRLAPRNADVLSALGAVLLHQNAPDAALEPLAKAATLRPKDAGAQAALGHVHLLRRQFDEAHQAFEKSLALDATDGGSWFALGFALAQSGQPRQAESAYRRALEIDPTSLDALNNLAGVLQTQGRAKEAAVLYHQALASAPNQTEVRANLALVLEMTNALAESEAEARRVLSEQPAHPGMRLLIAQLAFRAGNIDGAVQTATMLVENGAPSTLTAEAWHLIGQARDRLGQFDQAFAAFTSGNDLMARSASSVDADAMRYRRYVAAYGALGTPKVGAPRARDTGRRVAFFVGFPRSGTTLMEDILGAHPAIVTTGEHSPLEAARAALHAHAPGLRFPADLNTAPATLLDSAVDAYWQTASAEFGVTDKGVLFLDKLPLNIVEIGLIERLFPNAPILVALRDPRDVCLSCFTQHFSLNDAMANFLTLDDTARLYAAVMALWRDARAARANPWLEYRYEDLVADPDAVLRSVFAFLDLPWDAGLLERRLKPTDRYVATPSRDAVARPISNQAVGRWRHYRAHLATANTALAPFLTAFGYPLD
jgi:Flp pilus assembly protein TadD